MDEAGYDLFNQEWWSRFQIELNKKLMVIAKQCLTLIMVLPHRKDINAKIRDRRVTYWIEVKVRGAEMKRGFLVWREGVHNEWEQDPFWNALGACTFSGSKDDFWCSYESKKDEFISEVNKGEYGTRSDSSSTRLSDKERIMIKKLRAKGMSQKEIGELLDVTQQRISQVEKELLIV